VKVLPVEALFCGTALPRMGQGMHGDVDLALMRIHIKTPKGAISLSIDQGWQH